MRVLQSFTPLDGRRYVAVLAMLAYTVYALHVVTAVVQSQVSVKGSDVVFKDIVEPLEVSGTLSAVPLLCPGRATLSQLCESGQAVCTLQVCERKAS